MPLGMRRLVFGAMLVLTVPATAALAADLFPPMTQEGSGDELQNSCSPRELPNLRTQVMHVAGQRQPELVWKLASAILCGTGRSSERLTRAHMPKRLLSMASGSGEEDVKQFVARSQAIGSMLKSKAWAATAAPGEALEEIAVSAWTDPVSITTFILRFQHGRWLWVATSFASD